VSEWPSTVILTAPVDHALRELASQQTMHLIMAGPGSGALIDIFAERVSRASYR
jgi:hypothetical protein